ncbi:MAG TPA: recombinase family protein [Candidatus Angelobacter sp.]|nr:recombinase family protein [Candidatus Angelobacter sp.]
MKEFFSYVRVSTARQEEEGVSLQQQKEAIERCAARCGVKITQMFEEQETAAKRGRPIFSKMLKLLKAGKAAGVIIHKIDRSARNLRDWADLGELIDSGVEVYFANESLDLRSRGGRLAADIQAVVASDFIRNLREETKKGFYGRLKQGLCPMPAPLGYLNVGKGALKIVDPQKAPLVRKAFELYDTGEFSLDELVKEMYRRGLRSRNGKKVGRNSMSLLLNRRFYIGEIEIKKTGERFLGGHEPIVSPALFERVQEILSGRYPKRLKVHDFTFRKLLSCASCNYSLIGETHKGHIYYRCHTKGCPRAQAKETEIDGVLENLFLPLQFMEEEKQDWREQLKEMGHDFDSSKRQLEDVLRADLERTAQQSERLLEAYLDGALEKEVFEQKKTALAIKRREIEKQLRDKDEFLGQKIRSVENFLELAGDAYLLYKNASKEKKRELLENLTSNRSVKQKNIEITLNPAALAVAGRPKYSNGSPTRYTARKKCRFLWKLVELLGLPPAKSTRPSKLKWMRYA